MHRLGIRLFTLTIFAAALLTVPIVPPAKAAGNGVETAKARKKTQGNVSVSDRKDPTWPPPMYDDFDRKNAAGGGSM